MALALNATQRDTEGNTQEGEYTKAMLSRFIRKNYSRISAILFGFLIFMEVLPRVMTYVLKVPKDGPVFTTTAYILLAPALAALFMLYGMNFNSNWRDEYAEKLWQKAIRTYAMIILTIPWLWLLVWLAKHFFWPDAYWLPRDPNVEIIAQWGEDPKSVSHNQMAGVDFVLRMIFGYSPILFVILYKWHEWRDSR